MVEREQRFSERKSPLPQSLLVFPALSLALFFACAPLSERLEQATTQASPLLYPSLGALHYRSSIPVDLSSRAKNSKSAREFHVMGSSPVQRNVGIPLHCGAGGGGGEEGGETVGWVCLFSKGPTRLGLNICFDIRSTVWLTPNFGCPE